MSKAALVINDIGNNAPRVIGEVRKRTHLSIGEVRERCQAMLPVLEVDLFGSDLEKKIDGLKSFIIDLRAAGASFEIYRLLSRESFENVNASSVVKMDINMLDNILTAHRQEEKHYYNEILPESDSQEE